MEAVAESVEASDSAFARIPKKRKRGPQGVRGYCLTFYQPYPTPEKFLAACKEYKVDWFICGNEIAPITGKPHLQSAVYFTNHIRPSGVRKLFPGVHHELMAGTPREAYDYCLKDNSVYFEFGPPPPHGAGHASDLDRAIALIDAGATHEEFTRQIHSLRAQGRYFHLLSALLGEPVAKRTDKEVIYIYGVPGGGKSEYADQRAAESKFYRMGDGKWFDGYRGEDTIVVHDVGPKNMAWSILLKLTDVIPMRCEFKNGDFYINPRRVILTAQFPPDTLYAGVVLEKMVQFQRRITELHEFPEMHPSMVERMKTTFVPTVHRWT